MKQKISILFVLLILLISSFVPMTIADDGNSDEKINDFELIAVTTSNNTEEGSNFKFENIESGNYFILGGYTGTMGGSTTYYAAIQSITVTDESITDAYILGERCRTETANKTFEIFDSLKDENPAATPGIYSITGTFQAPKMSADPVNQKDSFVLLIRAPAIMNCEITYEGENAKIITTAYGTESVTAEYKDKTGKPVSVTKKDSGNVFELSVNLEDLKSGNTEILIKATAGDTVKTASATLYKAEEYKIIAVTTSNESESGPNFKFENLEPGNYFILGGYSNTMSGGTNYIAIKRITITSESVDNADILGERCRTDIANKTFEIFDSFKNEKPTATAGTYSITGTFQAPKMGADPISQPNSQIILLQMPVIIDSSSVTEGENLKVKALVYGADSVEFEYVNKIGEYIIIGTSENSEEYTAEIPITELPTGYVKISIIAKDGETANIKQITAINADPALMGVTRKVVIISGYETHNKIITDLAAKYEENGSNVELVSLETKSLMDKTPEEIQTIMADADVITIHMVSTTPTWNYFRSAILAECADGKVVILDDNATRQATAYDPYTVPPVPGISDTKDNFEKYQAKVANYWSNTPYEHKNLENMINMVLIDFYGRYDLGKPDPAVELPIKGIYHPHLENVFETDYDKYIEWYSENEETWNGEETPYKYDPKNPTVGITFYKSYYPDKMEPTAKLIEELEKKGVNVLAVYCEAPAYFDTNTDGGIYFKKGEIDAVLNYRYIGEHRFNQVELNVPVFNILIVDEAADWENSTNPFGNSSMKLVNQELIGAIDPIAVVSTEQIDGSVKNKPIIDQVDWMVERVIGQLNLQAKDNADKNVAIVYYNHGGGKGNIGASYLDVPASTINLLNAMKADDYNVDTSLVPDAEAMVTAMITQGINVGGWAPGELKKLIGDVDISENEEIYDTGKAILISTELYEKWFKEIYLGEWFEESIKTLSDEEKAEKTVKKQNCTTGKRKKSPTCGEQPREISWFTKTNTSSFLTLMSAILKQAEASY
jgi:Cobalamin biosynthesis protein CobN and related Mg-chelatases